MPLFLVDDRDGGIVAEIRTEHELGRVLELMASECRLPGYLCLVETRSRHGSILGADSSVKIRTLQ
jgi:hypothetical protein